MHKTSTDISTPLQPILKNSSYFFFCLLLVLLITMTTSKKAVPWIQSSPLFFCLFFAHKLFTNKAELWWARNKKPVFLQWLLLLFLSLKFWQNSFLHLPLSFNHLYEHTGPCDWFDETVLGGLSPFVETSVSEHMCAWEQM